MAAGTKGFDGANLTRAREARQITQASLARLLDVSRQSISDYELGRKTPSPSTMQRLQEFLNLPFNYFQQTPKTGEPGPIFYRSMSNATKGARLSAEARFGWLKTIFEYLADFVTFPTVNYPTFDVPSNPHRIDNDLIEDLADETRRFWNLGSGSISNVTWLLENNGTIIGRFPLEAETLDAFSEWDSSYDTPFVVLGDDKGMAARSRFDAAHELGHLILHRRIDRKRLTNTADFKLLEKQAHRFGAAFLFPAEAYLQEVFVPDLDLFRNLKATWKVSIQLQIYRGVDLGIITQDQATRLWKNCARRGWRRMEPLDDQIEVERPRVLARALDMVLKENVQSQYDVLAALPYSTGDILELAGLPRSYFESRLDTIVEFKEFKNRRNIAEKDDPDNDEGPAGHILRFNRSGR